MHNTPMLTTSVYVLIAVVLISVIVYWILYTRGLRTKRDTLDQKGRLPVSRNEGIAVATEKKEATGRTGTTS